MLNATRYTKSDGTPYYYTRVEAPEGHSYGGNSFGNVWESIGELIDDILPLTYSDYVIYVSFNAC